jgi:hypothetical protein
MLEASEHWRQSARGTWTAWCDRCHEPLTARARHSVMSETRIVAEITICSVCGLRNVLTFVMHEARHAAPESRVS